MDVATPGLAAEGPSLNLHSKSRGSGQPAGQLCFLTRRVPSKPRVWVQRARESSVSWRDVSCRSQDIQERHDFYFLRWAGDSHREIWPGKWDRTLGLRQPAGLATPRPSKAMSAQCDDPCDGTVFVIFLLVFPVMLVGFDHLKSSFNYAV